MSTLLPVKVENKDQKTTQASSFKKYSWSRTRNELTTAHSPAGDIAKDSNIPVSPFSTFL